jgi:hypothetical protein
MEWRRELAEEHSGVRPYFVLVRTRLSVAAIAKAVIRANLEGLGKIGQSIGAPVIAHDQQPPTTN